MKEKKGRRWRWKNGDLERGNLQLENEAYQNKDGESRIAITNEKEHVWEFQAAWEPVEYVFGSCRQAP